MIGLTIFIEVIILVLAIAIYCIAENEDSIALMIISTVLIIAFFIVPFGIGALHGYIDYKESNDRDLARITAVTQEQDIFKTYYIVEVEYLTNTPQQQGMIQNNRIERDIFYCYYEDKELVDQLKEHLYEELWIISGHKGGYETFKDFGTKLIKGIELKEREE